MAQVGTLTGLKVPYGERVDAKGDVYIANFGGASVVEYPHGGTKPIASFTTDGYTMDCSVDNKGDLAVGNFDNLSFGQGDVQGFFYGSSTPKRYTSGDCYEDWPPGYDPKGNLFVEGLSGNATHEHVTSPSGTCDGSFVAVMQPFWAYPAGGAPVATLPSGYQSDGEAVSISK
jgi:hypothetical protein